MGRWRVYYADGSIWGHARGTKGMPIYGVVCIVQESSEGVHVNNGGDYYALQDGEWAMLSEKGLEDYILHEIPYEKMICGRGLTTSRFRSIAGEAHSFRAAVMNGEDSL